MARGIIDDVSREIKDDECHHHRLRGLRENQAKIFTRQPNQRKGNGLTTPLRGKTRPEASSLPARQDRAKFTPATRSIAPPLAILHQCMDTATLTLPVGQPLMPPRSLSHRRPPPQRQPLYHHCVNVPRGPASLPLPALAFLSRRRHPRQLRASHNRTSVDLPIASLKSIDYCRCPRHRMLSVARRCRCCRCHLCCATSGKIRCGGVGPDHGTARSMRGHVGSTPPPPPR